MLKKINCEAIKPTKKPITLDKSKKIDENRHTAYSSVVKQRNMTLPDSVRESHGLNHSESPFKDHILYSQERDLASSFSLSDEDSEFQYQKLLFSNFLQSSESNWMTFMHDMNKISQEKLINFVKIGQSQKTVKNNRVIAHYIGVWLNSMGYKDIQTKKRIITSVQYLYPMEQEEVGKIAEILYDKLFQGYLPQTLQLRILVELCKRGWEYFSFFLGRFVKILKKYKNNKQDSFVQEVEKAI